MNDHDGLDHFEAGKNLFLQGKFAAAGTEFRLHLERDPSHAETHHLLGLLAHHSGQFENAILLLERAISLSPNVGEYYANLGNTLEVMGIKDRSLECYAKAVALRPDSAELLANYSTMLWHRLRLDEARQYALQAIALTPDLPAAQYALGNASKDLGLIDDALWAYKRAKSLSPGLLPLESGYLYALNYHPNLSPLAIANEHRNWAIQFADPISNAAAPFENAKDPNRKLRIGYVSNAFRDHSINFFIEPLLQHHDRDECEVFCYSDVFAGDEVTNRLCSLGHHWRSMVGLNDEAVVKMIRDDRIDILVDLHGHMGGTRIFVFARRAAPIQVTYLGYQATTGMGAMDYRFTDENADPSGKTESLHTERLYRLSPTYFCYQPPSDSPEISEPPFLKNGFVTFGSFNAINKVSAPVLNAWGMILRNLPNSKLRILSPDASSLHQRIGMALLAAGAKQTQIEFVIRSKRRRYLERIAEVDIALDPFPFNGHTTSCDALWMGVPVIMMRGSSYVQRYGSSALEVLKMNSCIAENAMDYVTASCALARNETYLVDLRRTLRSKMLNSSLMDYHGFATAVKDAYRTMWLDYVR